MIEERDTAIVDLPTTLPPPAQQKLVSALARVLARQTMAKIAGSEEPVLVAEEST